MEWEIVPVDESPKAAEHKITLEKFYRNCSVTHCLDQNTRGGISLLIRQMMRAIGDKFSVHEIVWQPMLSDEVKLSAEFRFVPLWFFENRTGQLRFLPYELALQGIPLEPAGWVVHVGEGLFQAMAIAYLIKRMGVQSWAAYCEKFGLPFLHGKTTAQFGSKEWNEFQEVLASFSNDGSILTTAGQEINPITVPSNSSMPMQELVDRMDRQSPAWRAGVTCRQCRRAGAGRSARTRKTRTN
jgi:phage gp29-like protein